MKKIISILFLVAFVASAAFSQFGTPYQFPVVRYDTLTNTQSTYKIITCTAGYDCIGIQPVVSKVSGTVAGTLYIYASLDGTNFYPTGDSMTLNNGTTTKLFKITNSAYYQYKVTLNSTGTDVIKWKLWYTLRKTAVTIIQ